MGLAEEWLQANWHKRIDTRTRKTCRYCRRTLPAGTFPIGWWAICLACYVVEDTRKEFYREYINSRFWRKKRRAKLESARATGCERCGRHEPCGKNPRWFLNVHHKTYENLGRERMEDLEVLCSDCHQKSHGKERQFHPVVRLIAEAIEGKEKRSR